jgi:hypothetical protein
MSLEGKAQPIRRGPTKLWLPIVWAIGIVVGLVLSYFVSAPSGFRRFGYPPFPFPEIITLHMALSTVSIALLVALAVIYFRMYAETGARFALGIGVVLFALLIQSVLQYPLVLGAVGAFPIGHGPFLSFADLFTIAAYSIFLYLSLE